MKQGISFIKFSCLALVLACGLANTAHAAEVVGQKHLTLPDFTGEELVAVLLDSDIYARSQASYSDLRLIDAHTDDEVPYLLRRAQTKRSRKVKQVWNPEDLAIKPLDNGGLEIRFRSDPKKHRRAPQGIRFVSPLVNFEHHVRVEVSDDGNEWRTVVEDGLIFDYSQFMDVRNFAIEPLDLDDKPEFYRLTIADVTQEQQSQLMELTRSLNGDDETSRTERIAINRQPFRIDRIELWIDEIRNDVPADREEAYPLEIDRTEQDVETKQTFVYLKSRREPLTEIAIETPARNFSRRTSVEMAVDHAGQTTWRPLASENLARIDFRTLKRESLTLSIPETRTTEYRMVIDNGDNPPLEVTKATGNGHVYEVVFLAAADKKYELTYGNDKTTAANYDTAVIVASLQEGFTPLTASLGAESLVEPAPEPPAPFFKRLLNNTWAMTSVIGVLVLVLAATLYRATRHLEEFQEP
jgi:hypothetical protein